MSDLKEMDRLHKVGAELKEQVLFIPCEGIHGGGSRQGTIEASFADLREMFGDPAFEGKGDNITTEFVIDVEYRDGIDDDTQRDSFCLYDWGYARDFGDDYKVITWNVGGKGFMSSLYASKALEIFEKTDVRYGLESAVLCHAEWHDWEVSK